MLCNMFVCAGIGMCMHVCRLARSTRHASLVCSSSFCLELPAASCCMHGKHENDCSSWESGTHHEPCIGCRCRRASYDLEQRGCFHRQGQHSLRRQCNICGQRWSSDLSKMKVPPCSSWRRRNPLGSCAPELHRRSLLRHLWPLGA